MSLVNDKLFYAVLIFSWSRCNTAVCTVCALCVCSLVTSLVYLNTLKKGTCIDFNDITLCVCACAYSITPY